MLFFPPGFAKATAIFESHVSNVLQHYFAPVNKTDFSLHNEKIVKLQKYSHRVTKRPKFALKYAVIHFPNPTC